jgi:hypothetical protein
MSVEKIQINESEFRSNGDSFALIGKVTTVMRRAGRSKEEREEFCKKATSGGYDNLLQECLKIVELVPDKIDLQDKF